LVGEQLVAPAEDVVPLGQAVHAIEPDALALVPAAHGVQATDPMEPANVPAAQNAHVVAPGPAANIPIAQGLHEVAFVALEDLPAAHATQLVPDRKVPGPQAEAAAGTHLVDPVAPPVFVPLAHGVHFVALLVENVSTGHEEHFMPSAEAVPAAHATHAPFCRLVPAPHLGVSAVADPPGIATIRIPTISMPTPPTITAYFLMGPRSTH
jgi:hypothetical protein